MRLFARFVALPAGDRRLIIEAAALLAAIRVGLVLMPFWHLRRLLAIVSRIIGRAADTDNPGTLPRVPWAVAAASRLGRPTCLAQALTTQALIEVHGSRATICIGVRRQSDGRFEAHASVEKSGRTVIGQPAAIYHALARLDRMRP